MGLHRSHVIHEFCHGQQLNEDSLRRNGILRYYSQCLLRGMHYYYRVVEAQGPIGISTSPSLNYNQGPR